MKPVVSFLIVLFLITFFIPFLKGEETVSSTLMSEDSQALFYPLDSWPQFDPDFSTVLALHVKNFKEILPPFPENRFYHLPDSRVVLSDHEVSWAEIADCLNRVACRVSCSNNPHHLYTGEVPKHITKRIVTLPKEKNQLFAQQRYVYEIKNTEEFSQPAQLSLATMQRYVNYREVHYWVYRQLRDQQEALKNDKEFNPHDNLVSYFSDRGLWPIVDEVKHIDHLDEIWVASTEVGAYWFSADGGRVEHVDKSSSYRLPTQEEIYIWGMQRGGIADSWGENVWGSSITDPSTDLAVNLEGGSLLKLQECYGLLALNTDTMKSNLHFNVEEVTLQQQRSHFAEFVGQAFIVKLLRNDMKEHRDF